MRRGKKTLLVCVGAAFTLLLSACAIGTGGSSGNGKGGESLTFVSFGGGYQKAQEAAIVKPWGAKNDVKILSDGPIDYAKVKAQVESGSPSWDVLSLEPFWAIANCGTLLEKIKDKVDTSNLPANVTSDCTIPIDIISYVLVYDTTKFGDNPPTSWADFFDTKKFPGKRGVWNFANSAALEAALMADGVPMDELYPLDVERGLKKFDTIREDINFYDTGAQQVQQLESQDVAMSIAWNGRAIDAVSNGAPYKPVWKGNVLVGDSWSVPKGSKNLDRAIELINYAVKPEPQAAFVEMYPYGPANSEAKPKLDDLAKSFAPLDPKHSSQGLWRNEEWWAKNYDATSETWTKWAAG